MTILLVANAPGDYIGAGDWSSQNRDAAYVPVSTLVYLANGVETPLRAFFAQPEAGSLWLHCRYAAPQPQSLSDGRILSLRTAEGAILFSLALQDGSPGAQVVGDTTVTGAYVSLAFGLHTFDIKLDVGAQIAAEVFLDGALVSSATAENTLGKAGPSLLVLDNWDSGNQSTNWSEVIVTDNESTLGWRLAQLNPAAAGFYAEWAGGFAQLADYDRATAASTSVPNAKVSSTLTAYGGPSSPTPIRAVVTKAQTKVGGSSPQNIQHFLRIGGADYFGSIQAAGDEYDPSSQQVWDQNPATGANWLTTAFAGTQIGLVAKA